MDRLHMPLLNQIFRAEYSPSSSPQFSDLEPVPRPRTVRDYVVTWYRLGRSTKERILFLLYLVTMDPIKDERVRTILGGAWWTLRGGLMEDNQISLVQQIYVLLSLLQNKQPGSQWFQIIYDAAASGVIEQSMTSAQRNFLCMNVVACFILTGSAFLTLVRLVHVFLHKSRDMNLLIRTMSACRIQLSSKMRRMVESFDQNDYSDKYLSKLRMFYGCSWLNVLAEPATKCAQCGGNCANALIQCGMCVQEYLKKKACYCSSECQNKDWERHSQQHRSDVDGKQFKALMEQFRSAVECVIHGRIHPIDSVDSMATKLNSLIQFYFSG